MKKNKEDFLNRLYATPKEVRMWNEGYKHGYQEGRVYQKGVSERLFKRKVGGKYYQICDAPGCMKYAKFQLGINSQEKIGNWCSNAHSSSYSK